MSKFKVELFPTRLADFNRYTYGFIVILIFSVLSGSIRKWVINNSLINTLVTFLQIALPWLLMLYLFKNSIRSQRSIKLLFIYIFLLSFFAFNPLNFTIYHGISGIIIHSSFLILFTFYFNFKEKIDFNVTISWVLILGLTETFLGAIQTVSPPTSWINAYAGFGEDTNQAATAFVGNAVRVTGTFSYLSGYTSFLLCYLFCNCYFLRKYPTSIWGFIGIFSGIYCALISGARGAVAIYLLMLLFFIPFETKILKTPKIIFTFLGMLFFFYIINVGLQDPLNIGDRFTQSTDNFMQRVDGSSEGASRIYSDPFDLFTRPFDYRITGIGLGSTYQGTVQLIGVSPLLKTVHYEGELFRLMIEGGVLLVLSRFLMLSYILSYMHFSLTLKIFLFLLIGLFVPLAFNIYNTVFVGIGMMILDQAYKKSSNA